MLTISHIYGHGFNRPQLSKLEKLGFRIRPQISTYMGSQICRFIDFEKGPSLEVIEVTNERDYLDFVPEGMKPYCPGIELALPEGSESSLAAFENEFSHLCPTTIHVNYDGSIDQRQPGWNYLNFETPVVTDTFIWLAESEEPIPVRESITDHPNGIKGILGFVFDLEPDKLRGFSKLVKQDLSGATIKIGGIEVWLKNTIEDFPDVHAKIFPLIAIILKAANLDYFAAQMDNVRKVSFMSGPAVHIETNMQSWDLLITL